MLGFICSLEIDLELNAFEYFELKQFNIFYENARLRAEFFTWIYFLVKNILDWILSG